MKTALIYNRSTDPAFNLAAEEFLTERFPDFGADRIMMLWRNSRSVIIGRNQNAFAEVDPDFAEKNGIPVYRRLTGGGAVFHDTGNVNYTVILPDSAESRLDYAGCTAPVSEALNALGLDVRLSGRNDLTAGGRKISGSAQCVNAGRVLHHGTLLWSADVSLMSGVLRPDADKLRSKGIASVSSRVANIKDLLAERGLRPEIGTPEDFIDYLLSFLGGVTDTLEDCGERIEEIASRRFRTWEWNWGRSPAFSVTRENRYQFGRVRAGFDADRGVIEKIGFSGDFFGRAPVSLLEEKLTGVRLTNGDLVAAAPDAGEYISGMTPEALADLLLGKRRLR